MIIKNIVKSEPDNIVKNITKDIIKTDINGGIDIIFLLDISSSMRTNMDSTESGLSVNDRRFCRTYAALPSSRFATIINSLFHFVNFLRDSINKNSKIGFIVTGSDLNDVARGLCGRLAQPLLLCSLTHDYNFFNAQLNVLRFNTYNANQTYKSLALGVDYCVNELTGRRSRPNVPKHIFFLGDTLPFDQPNYDIYLTSNQIALNNNIKISGISVASITDQTQYQNIASIGTGDFYHANDSAALISIMNTIANKVYT